MKCKCGCNRTFEIDKTKKGSGQNRVFYSKECGQAYRHKHKPKVVTHGAMAFGKVDRNG